MKGTFGGKGTVDVLSSTSGSETADFKKAFSHPESGSAYQGVHDSGALRGPVSGPNPKLKTESGPGVTSGPAGDPGRENFQYDASYQASGNKEFQGKTLTDVPLNDFKSESAHFKTT